ncbi:hypothetical protein D3C84_988880 [compost metagenome]
MERFLAGVYVFIKIVGSYCAEECKHDFKCNDQPKDPMMKQGRCDGSITVLELIQGRVHAQYMAEILVVCGVVGEIVVSRQ